jgi:hypothetical protein
VAVLEQPFFFKMSKKRQELHNNLIYNKEKNLDEAGRLR